MCVVDQLSEKKHFTINRCNECHKITVRHLHYALDFTSETFQQFSQFISSLDFQSHAQSYQDIEQMMVRVGNSFRLSFTREELDELKEVVDEASTMLQVYDVLRS
jgi:hypothetical protein